MKLKTERGFSGIEALIIVVIVGVLGGVGYWVYSQNHKKTPISSSIQTSTPTIKLDGTTQSVDNLTNQDANMEASIDGKYENTEQSTARAANQAAQNIGGAYDESTF